MSNAAVGRAIAQAILRHADISDRRRLTRLSVVALLILLTALYPSWWFTLAALAAIVRMAVLNRREALATATAVDTLLFASETLNDKEHPNV